MRLLHACCNGYLVSPLGGRGVREEGSQREGESRSERLSVVEGVRSHSAGSSPLLVLFLSLIHPDAQLHTDCTLAHINSKNALLKFSDRVYKADETDLCVCACVCDS